MDSEGRRERPAVRCLSGNYYVMQSASIGKTKVCRLTRLGENLTHARDAGSSLEHRDRNRVSQNSSSRFRRLDLAVSELTA